MPAPGSLLNLMRHPPTAVWIGLLDASNTEVPFSRGYRRQPLGPAWRALLNFVCEGSWPAIHKYAYYLGESGPLLAGPKPLTHPMQLQNGDTLNLNVAVHVAVDGEEAEELPGLMAASEPETPVVAVGEFGRAFDLGDKENG